MGWANVLRVVTVVINLLRSDALTIRNAGRIRTWLGP